MRSITRASLSPFLLLVGITLIGTGNLPAASAESTPALVTHVTVKGDTITFHTAGRHASVRMVVMGPEDWYRDVTFAADAAPTLAVTDQDVDGRTMSDGLYSVELMATPRIPRKIRAQLQAAREQGDKRAVRRALRKAGVSLEPRTHHQSFTVAGGTFVDPDLPEPRPEKKTGETPAATACRGCDLPAPTATLARLGTPAPWTFDAALRGDVLLVDQVFHQSVEIIGSLCVGLDCVSGESFGIDTIRLKENNVRINFWDTSATASFPKNHWTLKFNDSNNGGTSYFAVEDKTAGRHVFQINAGAPSNALFVASGTGNVGLGIASPGVELHMADGDTPAIRLEQTHVSGFTPQTWDIGSNETNFFVRDVTNGSKHPFKIRPGAPNDSLYINTNGNIGLGASNPTAPLHITNAAPVVRLDSTSSQDWDIFTNTNGFYVGDASTSGGPFWIQNGAPNSVFQVQTGQVLIGTAAEITQGLLVYNNGVTLQSGNVTCQNGSLTFQTGGTGINFSGGSTLDYYQEGTWTPTFTGSGGGTATYSANGRKGFYQRVGNWVTLQGRIKLTSLSGFSGTAQITGLPFAPLSSIGVVFSGSVGSLSGLGAALTGSPILYADRTGVIKLQQSDGATQTDVSPGATLTLAFSVSYQI